MRKTLQFQISRSDFWLISLKKKIILIFNKKWKSRYADIVHSNLKDTIFLKDKTIDQTNFDFKDFLQKVTEDYQNDNEFLDLLKAVNQEIEALKDFIRNHLAKDSSIYYVKEI